MKKILHIIAGILFLFAGGAAKAQISLNPSTLTWEAGSTQTKSVQVTSNGWWQCDSTVIENHFAISPQTGQSGTYLSVTPLSVNAASEAVTGAVEIYNNNAFAILNLVHEALQVSLSLSPSHLQWQWNESGAKTVTVSCNLSWSAALSSDAFTMVRSGNTLTFSPKDGRNDTASPRTATLSVTCGNSTQTASLYQGYAPYLDGFTSNTSYIQKTVFLTPNGTSYARDVSYYDGLGYPLQEVSVAASPQGGSIVTPIVYDNMRRGDATAYLPYVRGTGTAALDGSSTALSAQAAFYTLYFGDSHPFSLKEYGTSPAGQVKSIQKEGDAWAAGNGHKATIARTGYATTDDVMKLRFVPMTVNTPAMVIKNANDQYANGQLRKTRTTGEDGTTSDSFTDALGRTVCTRTWSGANATGTKSDTYYVRDLRDSTVLVIQPEGAVQFRSRSNDTLVIADTPSHPNNDIWREYCFSYRYETRGNCIEEHVPGGGTTRRVFDLRNRPFLETNDLLSATVQGDPFKAEPRYIRTVYDSLDRVREKKIVSTSVPHITLVLRARGDNLYNVWNEGDITTRGTFYEAGYYGFGNNAVSGFSADGVATAADVETVNIKGLLKSETLYQMPSADGTLPEEGSPCITRSYFYDKLGRVIQTAESDYPGWAARNSTEYDFAGRVVAKMESHCAPDDQSWHSLLTQYSYDDRGRLLSLYRELDGDELTMVYYSYDALGRMSTKTFGHYDDYIFGTQSFDYDIHGWSTGISASYNGNDLFSETLRYASTQKPGTAARWDGGIAEASFTDGDGSHTYAYEYDGMSRLKSAKHYAGDSNTVSNLCTEKNIGYNRNGCITGLERYGAEGLSEAPLFGYTGNRLSSIENRNGTGMMGLWFLTYDAMGNLITDGRKGLQFSYNLANLPENVEGTGGASLTYQYLSDGSKWRASANDGPSILYRGSFVYENDGTSTRISSIAWDEGRISYHYAPEPEPGDSLAVEFGEGVIDSLVVMDSLVVEDGICDEWHVRDHLGSVRAIAGIGNQITGVRELNTYLPFGTRIPGSIQAADNRHRFGGKEEQRYGTFNLGLSDFGARYYDPFTCRWTTRDPMAGKYHSLSPYNYCAGNPGNVVDPDGSIIGTVFDAVSLVTGVKSFVSNVKQGNVKDAIIDGVGIVLDAASLATPLVSSGAGMAIKAARGADKAADAFKAVNKADDVADAAKGAKSIESLRRQAVRDAWKAEKELVEKTGQGTRKWSQSEIQELLETGKVKGYEGHHINNVKDHPELAGNPDNITFLNKSEHLSKHGGNFRNETHGDLLDRTTH